MTPEDELALIREAYAKWQETHRHETVACNVCNATRVTLRKVEDGYLCEPHFYAVKRAAEEEFARQLRSNGDSPFRV